jgi:hypothetical protein
MTLDTVLYRRRAWVTPLGTADHGRSWTPPRTRRSAPSRWATRAMSTMRWQEAVAAFETFGRWPRADRIALLRRIREETAERLDDLAQAMCREMGAPITMAREVQAEAAIGHLDGFIAALEAQPERETLANGDTLVREPIGPVGLITPWNWPINQIALKVLPALATGCPAILKPSEHTPLSATLYAEILHDGGRARGRLRADARHRPRGRRRAGPAPRARHGLLHRLDPRRHLGDQGRRRHRQARDAGTGRQVPQPRLRRLRRRPRGPRARLRRRVLSSTPASPATRRPG